MSKKESNKKSGIVTLIGRSNVGKSTLLNALVGFKVAAVSPKAQTTRWAVKGILDEERGQVVFVDTPGLFIKSPDKLTKLINQQVKGNIKGIDLMLYVVDPTREIGQEELRLFAMVRDIKNKILVINKIDRPRPKYIYDYENLADDFLDMIKVSAKTHKHLKSLINLIFDNLPTGEPIYPQGKDRTVETANFKQWAAEIIREKIFHFVHQEVPYSTHVVIEDVEKNEGPRGPSHKDGTDKPGASMLVISARILTNEEKYKPMLIGKRGQKLKQIGTAARREMELILRQKIYLDLQIEVDPHWLERV